MSIEVRQLVIKSSVDSNRQDTDVEEKEAEPDNQPEIDACFDPEAFKEEVLKDCRRLVLEILADVKER